MTLPRNFYRDPFEILSWDEQRKIRERFGCLKCKHMDIDKGCKIKCRPGPRGFCPEWRNRD